MNSRKFYHGGPIFDGSHLLLEHRLIVSEGVIEAIEIDQGAVRGAEEVQLDNSLLMPGFVDLQVNGGGGVMFNDDPSLATLSKIFKAHQSLGSAGIMPTLITDTPEKTEAAISSVEAAIASGMDGILGLHLEGPHLSIEKKGAHEASFIRPMTDADLKTLIAAAQRLPNLMVTIAPESVSREQASALVAAGIRVSLGHTNADYETCKTYMSFGASCVTHLFNAMSQFTSREPGLVGAALSARSTHAGIIADGFHVHPDALKLAWAAKQGNGFFLVSDAMATAGSDIESFTLNGREIIRKDGKLTLSDGTLAGADLDIEKAIRLLRALDIQDEAILKAATSVPAGLLAPVDGVGHFRVGQRFWPAILPNWQ